MRIFDFMKQAKEEHQRIFNLFTPLGAGDRGVGLRLLLAGGTVAALGLALIAAINAMVLLLAALGSLYYLMTSVLGIKIDFDPQALLRQAQRYAGASAPN